MPTILIVHLSLLLSKCLLIPGIGLFFFVPVKLYLRGFFKEHIKNNISSTKQRFLLKFIEFLIICIARL